MIDEKAGNIACAYAKKILGFVHKRCRNIDEREELFSEIIFSLYSRLLTTEENQIKNMDGYVHQIARNTFARYLKDKKRNEMLIEKYVALDFTELHDCPKQNDSIYALLNEEIKYLNTMHRNVIRLYYYEKAKISEIARNLNISERNVYFHLDKAKIELKKGMVTSMQKKEERKPIKFAGMAYHGLTGACREMLENYMSNKLPQNILYSAYHKAKTASEIAKDLKIPYDYVISDIEKLVEYNFIDKVGDDKYLTNVLIYEPQEEILIKKHLIFSEYARIVCEKYVPLVFETMKNYDKGKIYSPENDFNFLMWSVVSYACGFKLVCNQDTNPLKKFYKMRNDGGFNIAFAWLQVDFQWDKLAYIQKVFNLSGELRAFKSDKKISWQLNTYLDGRQAKYYDNLISDYVALQEIIKGNFPKDDAHLSTYVRLYEKCYLMSKNKQDYINIVVLKMSDIEFREMLPEMPAELKKLSKKLDKEIYENDKSQFPKHMHELCCAWNTDVMCSFDFRAKILEQLLTDGKLKKLTQTKLKTVNTILFNDTLPPYS